MLPNQRSYSLVHGCTITRQTKCTVVCLCVYVWGCGARKGVAEKNVGEAFSTYLNQLYLMESNW